MKLIGKTRDGSTITKKYDKPLTPYRRVLASEDLSASDKANLRTLYRNLNPAALKRRITRLQQKLLRLCAAKKTTRTRSAA